MVYFILITVENLSNFDNSKVIKSLKSIKTLYENLLFDKNDFDPYYLRFGQELNRNSYNEDDQKLINDFINISAYFPDFKFGLYEFCHDFSTLNTYYIKGDKCIESYTTDLADKTGNLNMKILNNVLKVKINVNNVNLNGNITDIFNSNYKI